MSSRHSAHAVAGFVELAFALPASSAGRSRRAAALAGRKPSNTKRSLGNPATDNAAIAAQGPGTGDPVTPRPRHRRTKAGSLISGVPASEIGASSPPARRRASNQLHFLALVVLVQGPSWAWRCRNRPARGALWRVSSAAMRSALQHLHHTRSCHRGGRWGGDHPQRPVAAFMRWFPLAGRHHSRGRRGATRAAAIRYHRCFSGPG